jgi:hypothetical protein
MIGRRGYRIAERPRASFRPVPLNFASRDHRARVIQLQDGPARTATEPPLATIRRLVIVEDGTRIPRPVLHDQRLAPWCHARDPPTGMRCRNSRSSGQQRAGQFQRRRWASGGTRQPRANQAPPETIYGKELRYDYTPYPGSRSMQGVLQAF